VDKLLVAVTEPAPFRVRIAEPKVPLVQGGTMDLRIIAERDRDFSEPITVKMLWNPPGVSSLPDVTIPAGATGAVYVLNAKADADPRAWKIAVLGSAKVRGGELHVSSQLAPLEIGAPFLTAKIEPAACRPGQSTNIVVKLEQRIPFEGHAVIRLLGLSEKVSVQEQTITKDTAEAVFAVNVDPSCPTGSQRNLFCTVAVPKDGEIITHHAGQGGVLRVVPARKPAATATETRKVAKNP